MGMNCKLDKVIGITRITALYETDLSPRDR